MASEPYLGKVPANFVRPGRVRLARTEHLGRLAVFREIAQTIDDADIGGADAIARSLPRRVANSIREPGTIRGLGDWGSRFAVPEAWLVLVGGRSGCLGASSTALTAVIIIGLWFDTPATTEYEHHYAKHKIVPPHVIESTSYEHEQATTSSAESKFSSRRMA